MILIVLTIVVIALLIAVLAIFLFRIGMLLNRTAADLEDCAQSVKTVSNQASVIGPGVVRINETGTTVLGALPLLVDGAESVAVAKGAPYGAPPAPAPAPVRPVAAPAAAPSMVPALVPSQGVGYQDGERGSLGYLDA
ncbi:MAG TPA: hypothetical protein VE155_17125 [Pseudonocardiaceae bacterium]|nr:hypothetical protein [Pseudonocardiaceae bacterium]